MKRRCSSSEVVVDENGLTVVGSPANDRGVGTRWSLRSLPIQTIIWYDSMIVKRLPYSIKQIHYSPSVSPYNSIYIHTMSLWFCIFQGELIIKQVINYWHTKWLSLNLIHWFINQFLKSVLKLCSWSSPCITSTYWSILLVKCTFRRPIIIKIPSILVLHKMAVC